MTRYSVQPREIIFVWTYKAMDFYILQKTWLKILVKI